MTDRTLIKAVSRGDDLALHELFQRHAPWLARRLRRILKPDAVEDVLQETFIAVWKGAHGYKGDGEVEAWLWGVARRQAAMWCRKHGLHEVELPLDLEGNDDPATLAAHRTDLAVALDSLGPEGSDHRELVRLLWEEGCSVAEVASQLEIPKGTVKSRAHRVRRLLQAVLNKGGKYR